MTNCKYYDAENGWCKKFSDWHDAMPDIEYCVEGPCEYYELNRNTISVDAMYDIGDMVFMADYYDGWYMPIGPFVIDCINIRVGNQGVQLSYGIHNDAGSYTGTEDYLFVTETECTEWCKEQNRNL